MPKKRKAPALKTYPSVAQMIADTSPPKYSVKFLADVVHTLQQRVRTLELKIAIQGTELKDHGIFKLGPAINEKRIPVKKGLAMIRAGLAKGRRKKRK